MHLNQVTLPSLNVGESISFYSRMGFELIVDAAPRYARFLCPEGDATFSIHQVEQVHRDSGFTTYFECLNLDAKYEELLHLGYKFDSKPTDQPWLWREARLKDPAGNELCLFHAGENRVNPPWRVRTSREAGSKSTEA
jgi:catechol 2,3-dioxygenase-like lactoylglutathione lyase family enzyme